MEQNLGMTKIEGAKIFAQMMETGIATIVLELENTSSTLKKSVLFGGRIVDNLRNGGYPTTILHDTAILDSTMELYNGLDAIRLHRFNEEMLSVANGAILTEMKLIEIGDHAGNAAQKSVGITPIEVPTNMNTASPSQTTFGVADETKNGDVIKFPDAGLKGVILVNSMNIVRYNLEPNSRVRLSFTFKSIINKDMLNGFKR